MERKRCERCGASTPGFTKDADGKEIERDLFDYCAVCQLNLCEKCMAEGCCGNVPAKSGELADYGDE